MGKDHALIGIAMFFSVITQSSPCTHFCLSADRTCSAASTGLGTHHGNKQQCQELMPLFPRILLEMFPGSIIRNCKALGCSHHAAIPVPVGQPRWEPHCNTARSSCFNWNERLRKDCNLTSPDICDSKSNCFFFFLPSLKFPCTLG